MTSTDGNLVIQRHGRTTVLQALNDQTYYAALRAFGASEAVAQALTAKLITLPMTGKAN